MQTVVIASKNPVKINAVKIAFKDVFKNNFNFIGVSVASEVSNQPKTNEEILKGASRRVENAFKLIGDADFWVGIEGGIEEDDSNVGVFSWIVVKSKTKIGKAKTGTFFLPEEIVKYLNEGKELGEASDIVFSKNNSKQKNGAIGILTHDIVDRTTFYYQAVALALIPFINPKLY